MTVDVSLALKKATKITFSALTIEDAAAAFKVYDAARMALPFESKHHLVERDPQFFHNAAEDEDAVLIGAVAGGQRLVGIVVVRSAANWAEAARLSLVGCPHKDIAQKFKAASLVVVQSLCVLAGEKKQGIGTGLIKTAEDWAAKKGAAFILAQASHDNKCGRKKFREGAGFTETDPWTVSGNGTAARQKVLLYKNLGL